MGEWDYYMVQMPIRDVARQINYANDVVDQSRKTLDTAIQRKLSLTRVKGGIVDFLAKRSDRFFSSLVVGARGGNPQFLNIEIAPDSDLGQIMEGLDKNFGILRFNGEQGYYALDGQHRLKAIKLLLGIDTEEGYTPPPVPTGFPDEELSVLVLTLPDDVTDEEWLQKHRRLFASLNRNAKATTKLDNIIIDEDDSIAINTRRLVTEHPFFYYATPDQQESLRVKCRDSKNLSPNDSQFCHLETIYDMNSWLLNSSRRDQQGWGDHTDPEVTLTKFSNFTEFRPSEEHIDDLYQELKTYWDGILEAFPDLHEDPSTMRNHGCDTAEWLEDARPSRDHLLFWTIGQDLFAKIVRACLDEFLPDSADISKADVVEALRPLSNIPWDLHEAPWRNLVLVRTGQEGPWRMRSEERAATMKFCIPLLRWLTGIDPLNEEELDELKNAWRFRLYEPELNYVEEAWENMLELRARNL
tara:strand:+ start:956 stop:2365 length:1410 start_codon:yes stop_codon:yes gene_type:complete